MLVLLMILVHTIFLSAVLGDAQTVQGKLERLGAQGPYPASAVSIKLLDPNKKYSSQVYSDKEGIYYFYNVQPGEYILEIETFRDRSISYKIGVLNRPYTDIKPILLPYDIILYHKDDIAAIKEQLKAEFNREGFRIIELKSPLGQGAQTNAIFGGKLVPYTVLQSVLAITSKYNINIKTIQYKLDLKSKNPYEIQLGSSAAFNDKPPIPAQKLVQLQKASSDEEFKKIIEK